MTSEQKQFIEDIARYVRKYAPQYGIKCYSAIIAQAICESAWGKSRLSAQYHNYFGLKCGTKWTGGSVNMRTGEEYNGRRVTISDNFRTYKNMEEGVKGYFVFLFDGRTRYDNVKGVTDPQTYLRNIKADGYATSSSYISTNMSIVRTYGLTYYDPEDKSVKTNSGLVAYAKEQIGLPYWWGTFGQTATESLLSAKRKQYPSYYTAGDFGRQLGKRVHDCIGLIKGYLWSETPTSTPKYNSAQDVSAQGMYDKCTKHGNIGSFDKVKGRLLFKGSSASHITHVGVYAGDGVVYEARGHAYGVIKSDFSSGSWTHWGQCPWITCDTEQAAGNDKTEEAKTVSKSVVKDYRKAVGDGAERVFKEVCKIKCKHSGASSWNEMVEKRSISCSSSGSIALQLGGCMTPGKKMGHVYVKGTGIKPSDIKTIKDAMFGVENIRHCRLIWVNCYERDLPHWLKGRGVIYIQWSNCCVSAGMVDGKHWVWSCNEEGGYHRQSDGSMRYDQYKETSGRSGVLSCGGHYPWDGRIFVCIVPDDRWYQHYAVEAILGMYGDGEDRKAAFGKSYDTIQAFVNKMLADEDYFLRWAADYVLERYAGDGEERKRKLGKYYHSIQDKVNNVIILAQQCIDKTIPSGEKRKKKLGKDYEIVQKQINRMI